MDRAGEMCPRADIQLKGKSVKKLEAHIVSLEKALREREQRLGGSREEIYKRFVKADAVYEENHKIVKDLKECAEVSIRIKAGCWRRLKHVYFPICSDYAAGIRASRQPLDRVPNAYCYKSSYSVHSALGSTRLWVERDLYHQRCLNIDWVCIPFRHW
jgi:hypothetical protein